MCSFQLRELFFNLIGLRPDAAVNELLRMVGEMHHAGEVLAQADGIDDREF